MTSTSWPSSSLHATLTREAARRSNPVPGSGTSPERARWRGGAAASAVTLWFNPRCSMCRGADELLRAAGVDLATVHHLDEPPSRDEIVRVLGLLGLDDPRGLMRHGEAEYAGIPADASYDDLVTALATHPALTEQPAVIRGDSAVIARPPELLLALLDEG